jgi:phosphate-selective porin OprO/OprP
VALLILLAVASTSLDSDVEQYLDATEMNWRWQFGPVGETAEGAFSFRVTGRIHFEMDFRDSDPGLDPALGENNVAIPRALFGVKGTIYKKTAFWLEANFGSGKAVLWDAFVGLKGDQGGLLAIGHFRRPFGLEILTSSNDWSFVARPPTSQAFHPVYDSGIAWSGPLLESRRLWFGVGTFFNTGLNGEFNGNGGWALTARAGGLVIQREENGAFVWLAAAFQYQNLRATGQAARYVAKPATSLGPFALDTGSVSAGSEMRLGFEFAARVGAVHAQAELDFARPDAEGDPTLWGCYAQVGWFITGEQRVWSKVRGVWGLTPPTASFHTAESGRGAWEVAVRWDRTDLSDGGVVGGELDTLTVGVNWYWNPNMRVMLNYAYADISDAPTGTGSLNLVVLRWQIRY